MLIRPLIENADLPAGTLWGRLMIAKMNLFHSSLSRWGLSALPRSGATRSLDIGCGGGRNVARMRHRHHGGLAYGVDLSPLSVRQSTWYNLPAILRGRSAILAADAEELPFRDGYFDVVTAFETIYYWPDLDGAFREVRRVLRTGGVFLICNEAHLDPARPDAYEALTAILKSMTFYTNDDLVARLVAAGFKDIRAEHHPNGEWIRVLAHV